MKLLIASTVLLLTHSLLYAQNSGFTMSDSGDFFQNGKKIGQVVKTAKANLLIPTMAEFTVYDVNGVPRFLFERNEGKFIFLDDNKSFLPRKVDAYLKQVAEFFASDSILTPRGYNVAYRSLFIKKHKGFNFSEKSERDYNAPLRYIENNILQGETLIGRFEYRVMDNKKDVQVAVYDLNNKKVAFISTDNNVEGNMTGQVDMTILDENEKIIRVFKKQVDAGLLYKTGISWIVETGFLGSNGEVKTKKVAEPAEEVKPAVVMPIVGKDPQPERTEELRRAASQNDAEVQFKLFKNPFVSYEERFMWLKKAAENGHAESQYELGRIYHQGSDYLYGKGASQNREEALKWYRKSAEQGFGEAQWEVGIYYQIGYGVVKEDCEESLKWLLKAANQDDDVWRQFRIAEMYEKGYMYERCVKKSREEAIVWYKKAANNKNPKHSDVKAELARKKLEKWKVDYKE